MQAVLVEGRECGVNNDTLLPLELLGPGEWADVTEVTGEPVWVNRMAELGVRAGCRLCVLQPGSPCLLQVGGARLCLRGECAMQIMVRPVAAAS
jgi:Fe2+ transport system protein FeoA